MSHKGLIRFFAFWNKTSLEINSSVIVQQKSSCGLRARFRLPEDAPRVRVRLLLPERPGCPRGARRFERRAGGRTQKRGRRETRTKQPAGGIQGKGRQHPRSRSRLRPGPARPFLAPCPAPGPRSGAGREPYLGPPRSPPRSAPRPLLRERGRPAFIR